MDNYLATGALCLFRPRFRQLTDVLFGDYVTKLRHSIPFHCSGFSFSESEVIPTAEPSGSNSLGHQSIAAETAFTKLCTTRESLI